MISFQKDLALFLKNKPKFYNKITTQQNIYFAKIIKLEFVKQNISSRFRLFKKGLNFHQNFNSQLR